MLKQFCSGCSDSTACTLGVLHLPLGCCGGCSEGGSLKGMEKHGVTTINELVMKSYLVWHTSRVFTYWNQVFFCSDNFLMIQQAEVFLHPRPLGDFFTGLVLSVGLCSDQNTFKMKQSTGFTLQIWRGLLSVCLKSSLGLGGTNQKLVLSVWL